MTETRNGRRGRKSLRNRLSEEDLHDMVYENAIDLNATSTSYPANNGLAHSHTMNNQAHFEPIVASPPPPLSPSLVLDDMATVGVVTRAKARELWATYCQQSTTSPTMANYNSSFMQVVAENANNNKTSHYSQPHHTDISDNYRETTPPLSEEGRTMFTPMFKSLSVSQPKTPTTRPKKRTAKKSAVIDAANACLSIATQTSDVTTRNVMTSTRLSSTESIGEVQNDPAIAPQSVSPNSILYSNPLVAMMPRSASNSNIQSTSTTNGEPIQRVTTPPPKTSAEPPTQTITDDVIFSSPNRMPGSPTFNRHPNRSDANRYISRPNGAQWEQRAELHAARHVGAVVAQLTSNNHKRSAPETDTEHAQSQRYEAFNAIAGIEMLGGEPNNALLRTRPMDISRSGTGHRRNRTVVPTPHMSPTRQANTQGPLIGWRSHDTLLNRFDEDGQPRANQQQQQQQQQQHQTQRLSTSQNDANLSPQSPILNFSSPSRVSGRRYNALANTNLADISPMSPRRFLTTIAAAGSLISPTSLDILGQPRMPLVSVSSQPSKVLDAPEIADDYYLNLLDWSSTNLLGVGLGRNVYIWNAVTSDVTKLCEVPPNDIVTSVSWTPQGNTLAVATQSGKIQIWDAQRVKEVRAYTSHRRRICAMSWCGTTLASGGRDRIIVQRDLRSPRGDIQRLTAHRGEICGLRWNHSNTQLASGANDNQVFIWDRRQTSTQMWQFSDHTAAVKAIAWSPHQEGLLATGGGSQDGCIRFWNTLTGTALNTIDTQSQVCNLAWSRHSNELVSAHGFARNDLRIWRYPLLRQVATLTGHTKRILYMALSPDGRTVVTGTPDETLRFWQVFSQSRTNERNNDPLSIEGRVR